jgi:hypothetical protein
MQETELMNQEITEELLEDARIARIEVCYNKCALLRVQILRKKRFNGLGVFRVGKLLGDRPTGSTVQQGQAKFLCSALFWMLFVVENNLELFYGGITTFSTESANAL